MFLNFNQPSVNELTRVLSIEGVTVAGLLVCICLYLIWEKRQERKKYETRIDELLKDIRQEGAENKAALIELVSKSILAAEHNTLAIKNIRDVLKDRQ